MSHQVTVIGGGLAGSEAAWQLATRGVSVTLYEMKPQTFSPAHQSPNLAELVCSNSFGSLHESSGSGMLQAEATLLGSFILDTARKNAVPAGRSLAVDREVFAAAVTGRLEAHPRVTIVREEVKALPTDRPLIVASGPLTGADLAASIQARLGQTSLYFYDAISPILHGDSINREKVFLASRYEDGPGDYLNCPMDEAEYTAFVNALKEAETYPSHPFEDERLFHGCQPIEAIAASGFKTLSFGPMKPVGLVDPRTGRRPYAVVQLRQEDRVGQLWNIVGFQTKMRRGAQTRVLRMIPGLEEAEIVRFGSIHRNTFLKAPGLLSPRLALRDEPGLHFAGQITGVEGYLESTACGLMCALYVYSELVGSPLVPPPDASMLGGLLKYLRDSDPATFQPMNSNFGLLPPVETRRGQGKKERRDLATRRGLEAFRGWIQAVPPPLEPLPESWFCNPSDGPSGQISAGS